jgi:hypothetical protein
MSAPVQGEEETVALISTKTPRGTIWLAGAAGLLFLGVAAAYAWFTVFSRPMSPDEGYLMITVQSFLEGAPLYDSVFTQYGPAYYFYEWVVRMVLSVPLTHDATRMLAIVHWLATALVLGCAARAMTGSWLAGLFVFAQAMVHLAAMAGEPGHPQELVALLLALGMLAAIRDGSRFERLAVLGAIAALLAFTKINAGLFFGVALFLGLRCAAKDGLARGVWTWLLAGVCAVLPFFLMWGHLKADWCRNYSVLAASAIAASWLIAQRFACGNAWGYARIRNGASAFLVVCVGIIGIVLWTGTSLRGLLDGLLLTPLKLSGVALLPAKLPNAVMFNAAGALVVAIVVRLKSQERRMRNAVTILKAVFSIAGSFCVIGNATPQLAFLLPWVWLVAVPSVEEPDRNSRESFPRVFLCLAAAWQGLQAYPIAGTQVMMATLLLVVAYGVCLADVFNSLAVQGQSPKWLIALPPRRIQLANALVVVALLCIFSNAWCKLPALRSHYASLPVLDLPGSRHVRFDLETTAMYRKLAEYLEKECDTFVTYPGFNSLYFWAGKHPPTHLNSTGWGQLTHRQQEQILGSLRQARRPLLVVVAAAVESWRNGAPERIRPLVRTVQEDYREIDRIGRFIVFAPRRAADTARRE